MVKKLISTFLTVLICLSAFCTVGVTAESTEYTEGYYTYTVENGKATIVKADDSYLEGNVVVPETLGGYPVVTIGDNAFFCCSFITELTLPSGITRIGTSAFEWCDGLTDITLPDSITTIEASAFSGCMSLESITIPANVTAIARDTFFECESLTTVNLHDGVTSIGGGAFRDCSSLTTISLPVGITSIGYKAFTGTGYYNKSTNWSNSRTVLYIGKNLVDVKNNEISGSYTVTSGTKVIANSVFTACNELTSVTVPSSVIAIGSSAFYNCAGLTTVKISGSITEIKADTFKSCPVLKTVTLPATVTAIGENAFSGCVKLSTCALPDSVTSIGEKAFFECAALTTVNLNNNIVSIGENAFSGCKKLTAITIPEKITRIGTDMFRDCVALSSISLSDNIVTIGNNAFTNTAYYNDSDNWEDNVLYIGNHLIEVKKGTYKDEFDLDMSYGLISGEYTVKAGTVTIAQSAFLDCINLTDVILSDGLENINQSAFANCKSLKSITLPYTVTSIPASAFSLCKSLETIYYNGTRAQFRKIRIGSDNEYFTADKVVYTNMSDPELYTYTVENGEATVTGIDESATGGILIPDELGGYPVTAIGDYAFYWRKNITNVIIPDCVTSIGKYAFSNCTSLTGVSLPDGIDAIPEGAFFGCTSLPRFVIPDSVTSVEGKAFYGCTGLGSVTFSQNLEDIEEYAFYNCSSLTSVSVPDSTDTIGNAVFAMCKKLSSATLPKEIESLGGAVFYCCRNLTSVNLPANITAIGEAMFYGCESLENITIPDSVTDIGEGAFYYCTAITEIEIPTSVTNIREYAFDGCENLATVYYNGTQNDFDEISFGSNNLPLENAEKSYLYVITFKNYDGTVIDEQLLPAGATITPPESPSREGTAQYSYTFTGWSGYTDGMTVTGDMTFTAEYKQTTNNYTYTFKNYDGTVIAEGTIPYGTEIPFPGVAQKPGDLENSYTFAEWGGYSFGMKITGDCTFTAVFIPTPNRFRGELSDNGKVTITAVDTLLSGDVTIPSTLCGYPVVAIGDNALDGCKNIKTVTIPSGVTSIGKSAFSGCSSLTNISIPNDVAVIKDGTFSDCISLKNITINKNITSIGKGAFYGCTSLENIYYSGTSADFKNIAVSSVDNEYFNNATVVYSFFVITFKDYDGTILKTDSLSSGDVITAPATNPVREKDAQYTYEFSGWDGFVSGMTVTGDMIFTATYREILNKYTYNFKNYDGKVLKTVTADYGTEILPPENPTRVPDVQYTYTFSGWDGYTDGMTLTGDVTFTAKFEQTVNQYTYNFINDDGTVLKTVTAEYGTVITPPEIEHADYLDLTWNGFSEGMLLTGNIDFTAIYTYNRVVIKADKTDDGKYHVNVFGAEGTPVVFVGFYNGYRCVDVKSDTYSPDGVTLGSDKLYDNVKIMVWDSYSTLKPIADVIIK